MKLVFTRAGKQQLRGHLNTDSLKKTLKHVFNCSCSVLETFVKCAVRFDVNLHVNLLSVAHSLKKPESVFIKGSGL